MSLFPILLCLLLSLSPPASRISAAAAWAPQGLHMSYTAFHTTEKQTLSLKAGEEIALSWSARRDPVHHHLEGGGGTHL
ncbi:MAG: hypothetical protein ACLR53_07505 [Evtepia gabavorous]